MTDPYLVTPFSYLQNVLTLEGPAIVVVTLKVALTFMLIWLDLFT